MVLNGVGITAFVKAVLEVRGEVSEKLLSKGTGPSRNGSGAGGVKRGNERAEILEDLHGGVGGFLAGVGVEARRGKLAKFVKNSLGGGFIRDGSADVVLLQEVAKTGEVAVARESGKGISGGRAGEDFWVGGEAKGKAMVGVHGSGAEFSFKGCRAREELKRAVIVGVSGGRRCGNSRAHGSGNGGVGSGWRGVVGGSGGVSAVGRNFSVKVARLDGIG